MIWRRKKEEPRAWVVRGGEVQNLTLAVLGSEHTLIAGTTGCGKSTLLNGMIADLLKSKAPSEARLILIDPKRSELQYLKDLPHTIGYADNVDKAVDLFAWAVREMDRRYRVIQEERSRVYRGSDIYIVIDEIHPMVLSRRRGEVWQLLSLLLTQGRASGIHVIACTQCPNRACLPNTINPLFTTRIGMRCVSPIESRQVIGFKGCEALPKHGRVLVVYEGALHEVRVPMTNFAELDELVDYWESDRCRA